MSTNLLIGLFVTLAVAAGGGYLVYTNMQTNAEVVQEIETEDKKLQPATKDALSGTFASLLGLGQNLRCEFSYNDGPNISSGTVFIAENGKRLRGDFSVESSAAGAMEMHMLREEGYNYMWGSSFEQGMKMKVEEGSEGDLFASNDASVAIDENTTYNCVPWNVDAEVLALPSDVEFLDLSLQMDQMMQLQGQGIQMQGQGSVDIEAIKTKQCAACGQITDLSAKTQCLQALQCL
jgi:hypothetical protein